MFIDITIRNATVEQAEVLMMAFNAVNNGQVTKPEQGVIKGDGTGQPLPLATTNANPSNNNGQPNFNGNQGNDAGAGNQGGQQGQPNSQPVVHTNGPNAGTSAPSTNNAEVDSSGLPWDERIHAGSKTRNADGKWKKRKGVNQMTVETVETELRANSAAKQPLPNFNAADQANQGGGQQGQQPNNAGGFQGNNNGQPNFNAQPNFNGDAGNNGGGQQGQQPNNAGAQQGNPDPVNNQGSDFAAMMQRINNATAAGKIDGMYLVGLCSRVNAVHGTTVGSVTDLMNRPVLIQEAMNLMTQDNKGI